MIDIKSQEEVEKIREAGRLVADALVALGRFIEPGVTTNDMDRFVEEYLEKNGVVSAFKGYRGFPANICVSINEEVVHGLPSGRKLMEGDIVSIDLGSVKDGFYGDAARTFPVGEVSENARNLMEVTRESLARGIAMARKGNRLYDISSAIQTHVESNGFSVVRDYVGHGIGRSLHEEPQVPNFGLAGTGVRLKPGMVLAVEPMVNEGSWEVKVDRDHWTVKTRDGHLSAHFEDIVAVTENGPDILTLPSEGLYV
jgi:methionyl aminopeptidase